MTKELKYTTSPPDEQGLLTITLVRDGQEALTLRCRDVVWDRPGFDREAWLRGTAERLQSESGQAPETPQGPIAPPIPRPPVERATIRAPIETAVMDRPKPIERKVPTMAQNQPTPDGIAGAIAEVREKIATQGRSSLGAIMKLAVSGDFAEPTAELVSMAIENLQGQAERILLACFPGVTAEAVATAQRALRESGD